MTTSEINKNIAATILQQLGGNRFVAMTGAKNFTFDGPSLTFHLPNVQNKCKAKYVKVTLNSLDLYDLEFLGAMDKTWNCKRVAFRNGVYCDDLQNVFTDITGLYTSL